MRAETREETRVHQPTSHPPGSASPGQPSPVHSPTRVLVRGAGRRGGTPGRHTNIEQDQGRPGLGRDQRGRGVQHAEHRPVRLPPPRPAPPRATRWPVSAAAVFCSPGGTIPNCPDTASALGRAPHSCRHTRGADVSGHGRRGGERLGRCAGPWELYRVVAVLSCCRPAPPWPPLTSYHPALICAGPSLTQPSPAARHCLHYT